jgi:hypothetical protein
VKLGNYTKPKEKSRPLGMSRDFDIRKKVALQRLYPNGIIPASSKASIAAAAAKLETMCFM